MYSKVQDLEQKKRQLSTAPKIPFSVLMAVYAKEDPEHFRIALESIWQNQTVKPSEIVLIKDGPLTEELEMVITSFEESAPLKIHQLDHNQGLGVALAEGIHLCQNELVARMDSDDISAPDRFEKQLRFMTGYPEVAISGTFIAEFVTSTDLICSYRKLPVVHPQILRFAKQRNPMNHMTVFFKKSAVLQAGNYQPFLGYEDYWLWIRMLQNKCLMANLPESLVYARIGNNMHARRHGSKFFLQELKLQQRLLRVGFLTKSDYVKNIFLRAFPRLLPIWGLKLVYSFIRK